MHGLPACEFAGARDGYVGNTRTAADGRRYRVVTTYQYPGQGYRLPEAARDVAVEPLPHGNAVRITYLSPLTEIPFVSDEPRRCIN